MSLSKNDIKFIRSLHQKKNRLNNKRFIVEGEKLVEELLKYRPKQIENIFHLESCALPFEDSLPTTVISDKDLKRISALKTPNQVLAVVKQFDQGNYDFQKMKFVILLENINDPGNFGTIMRTADWFDADSIICSPQTVEVYNPKVVQASMGAIFRINTIYSDLTSIISDLKEEGFEIFGASMNGENAFQTKFQDKTAIVLGSESHGLSQNIKDLVKEITIPKFGESESLNVAMAGGILMAQVKQSV